MSDAPGLGEDKGHANLLCVISLQLIDLPLVRRGEENAEVGVNVLRTSSNVREVAMSRVGTCELQGDQVFLNPNGRFHHKQYSVLLHSCWSPLEEVTMELSAARALVTSRSQGGKLRPLSLPRQVSTCPAGSKLTVRCSKDIAQPPPVLGASLLLEALQVLEREPLSLPTKFDPAVLEEIVATLTSKRSNPYAQPAHFSSGGDSSASHAGPVAVSSLLCELSDHFSTHCDGLCSRTGVWRAACCLRVCCKLVLTAEKGGTLQDDLHPLALCIGDLLAVEGKSHFFTPSSFFCMAFQRLTGVCGTFLNGQHWAAQALWGVLGLHSRHDCSDRHLALGQAPNSPHEFSLKLSLADSWDQPLQASSCGESEENSQKCPVTFRQVPKGGMTTRVVIEAKTLSRLSAEEEDKNQERTEDSVV